MVIMILISETVDRQVKILVKIIYIDDCNVCFVSISNVNIKDTNTNICIFSTSTSNVEVGVGFEAGL